MAPKTKLDVTTMTWATLMATLKPNAKSKVTEADCLQMLKDELGGAARPTYLMRIYGRFNTLRTDRERRELSAAKMPKTIVTA